MYCIWSTVTLMKISNSRTFSSYKSKQCYVRKQRPEYFSLPTWNISTGTMKTQRTKNMILSNSSIRNPSLSPMVDCKHLTLNLQPHGGINSANWTDPPTPTPRVPVDWDTNQRVHMEGPMALAAKVAENGLVGTQLEERPLGLRVFNAPV
jgi:hypothetical protein